MKKPKTVEVTLRVRVPKDMSAAQAKAEIANNWYGEVYASYQTDNHRDGYREVVLNPRWSKARVVRKAAHA